MRGADGVVQRQVCRVAPVAQGVEDERVQALEVAPGFGGDAGDVGAVGEGEGGLTA